FKQNRPNVKVALGGGFANTELRSLSDARVFEFSDFVTLDDGERPLELIVDYIAGKSTELKRTFLLNDGAVQYIDNSALPDYKQLEVGTPDYQDLPLDRYLSVLELANPMHRLWTDGRWNKLT